MNIRPPHPIWVPRLDAGLELAHVDVRVHGDVRLRRAKRDHDAVNITAMQMSRENSGCGRGKGSQI